MLPRTSSLFLSHLPLQRCFKGRPGSYSHAIPRARPPHTRAGSVRWATPAMLLLAAGMCYVAVSNYVTKELGRGE
jgi:hypothetical protein